MTLSEESIERFFSTLIKIVEDKNQVKIKYEIRSEDEKEN